jgi:hypothetical protein
MSLESDVVGVLRTDPAGRISFLLDRYTVNRTQMELVAKAIESGDIGVEVGPPNTKFDANYDSHRGRRLDPGEPKIGKITVRDANVVQRPIGRAGVFHESVHALADLRSDHITPTNNEEALAYIADAMYLRATKTTVSGSPEAKAIYKAAFDLVDTKKMLAKSGVTLKWSDCDDLVKAIAVVYGA